MLYILGSITHTFNRKEEEEVIRYRVIDTLSESYMLILPTQLESIIATSNIQVANAIIHNSKIQVNDWVKKVIEGPTSINKEDSEKCSVILLAKEGNKYKVADYTGEIGKISFKQLEERIHGRKVANCSIEDIKNGQIKGIDTYEIIEDKKFETETESKYEAFIAKLGLLGYGDMSFEYEIENHQVKLKKYIGSSTNIILPSFITAIMEKAFEDVDMDTINLNEGLEVIGRLAFGCRRRLEELNRVIIPSTVQLIGNEAFYNHSKLYSTDIRLNMSRVELRNSNTIIVR